MSRAETGQPDNTILDLVVMLSVFTPPSVGSVLCLEAERITTKTEDSLFSAH